MKKLTVLFLFLVYTGICSFAQKKIINVPDLPGFVSLKCDFHTHTVFSDGNVWPTFRIDEAVADGLDAIAITDHIEYVPKKTYIPVDHNAAWKIGEAYARERNLLLVHGTEITRKMPPGHFNALFITDASLLAKDSVWDCFEEAIKQGAFLQWNHPGWKAQQPDGIPVMNEYTLRLAEKGWLHGIEFFNDSEYYPEVFRFCTQYNAALMGNSDVHGIISEIYSEPEYSNRPMTLVFAKEKSLDALKEAMFAGRTLVYFKDMLAGKEEFAKPFFQACISIGKPYFQNEKNYFFEIANHSDITFLLVNGPADAPEFIRLPSNSVAIVSVSKKLTSPLIYDVKNILIGSDEFLKIELK